MNIVRQLQLANHIRVFTLLTKTLHLTQRSLYAQEVELLEINFLPQAVRTNTAPIAISFHKLKSSGNKEYLKGPTKRKIMYLKIEEVDFPRLKRPNLFNPHLSQREFLTQTQR